MNVPHSRFFPTAATSYVCNNPPVLSSAVADIQSLQFADSGESDHFGLQLSIGCQWTVRRSGMLWAPVSLRGLFKVSNFALCIQTYKHDAERYETTPNTQGIFANQWGTNHGLTLIAAFLPPASTSFIHKTTIISAGKYSTSDHHGPAILKESVCLHNPLHLVDPRRQWGQRSHHALGSFPNVHHPGDPRHSLGGKAASSR